MTVYTPEVGDRITKLLAEFKLSSAAAQTTNQLIQQLLAARRDLSLPRALRALDAYDVMILEDLGYVQQSADEAEVLFTLMAERDERRSLIITSSPATWSSASGTGSSRTR